MFNNVPTGEFHCLWNARDQRVALCKTTDSKSSHPVPLHSRSLKQCSKDGWHLVEALGSATIPISHCVFDRGWVENRPTSDFPLPVWIFSQVFACHMSSVILTDIIQTEECFLSKCTNNMHILATGTEEQAVYSGHLWAPYSSKLLNTAPAAIKS